jgi:hypothetical protein
VALAGPPAALPHRAHLRAPGTAAREIDDLWLARRARRARAPSRHWHVGRRVHGAVPLRRCHWRPRAGEGEVPERPFVVAAPERHVLAAYTPKQNADVVGALLAGYKGTLVVDAHAVYDHLFESAHRRSVPDRARPRDRTSRTAARDAQARGGAHHREVLRLVRCRGRARARRDSIGEGHRLLAQPARGAHALPRGRAHPDTQQLLRT